MNKISVIKTCTPRIAANQGSSAIDTDLVQPGAEFEYDFLQGAGLAPDGTYLPNGDIWARLTKQIKNRAGRLVVAFIAVRVNGSEYSQKIFIPGDAGGSEFDRGWNARGVADAQAVALAVGSLNK